MAAKTKNSPFSELDAQEAKEFRNHYANISKMKDMTAKINDAYATHAATLMGPRSSGSMAAKSAVGEVLQPAYDYLQSSMSQPSMRMQALAYEGGWIHRNKARQALEDHEAARNELDEARKKLRDIRWPKTEKSEPRAAILARGILAAVELRKAHYGTGRGKYPRPWKDNQSGRMHQDLTHLLPEQYHATHSMEASWLPGMPQHVSAKVTYKHPSYGTSEALGFTSHGGSKEWYEGSGAASQHSKAHEIQPHADAAFGRFLQSKMMAPHHPDRG